MTPEELREASTVRLAASNGAEIEVTIRPCRKKSEAQEDPRSDWCDAITYWIKLVIQDTVDWSQIHRDFRWMARDSDGKVHVFTYRPEPSGSCFGGDCRKAAVHHLVSYKRGNTDWKDSLVRRPVAVEHVWRSDRTYSVREVGE